MGLVTWRFLLDKQYREKSRMPEFTFEQWLTLLIVLIFAIGGIIGFLILRDPGILGVTMVGIIIVAGVYGIGAQ